ncbi:hypothetical protein ACMFMG_000385 [Clarireedia jacksonii]
MAQRGTQVWDLINPELEKQPELPDEPDLPSFKVVAPDAVSPKAYSQDNFASIYPLSQRMRHNMEDTSHSSRKTGSIHESQVASLLEFYTTNIEIIEQLAGYKISTDYDEFVALLRRTSDSLADTARIKAGKGRIVLYPQADGRETSSSKPSRSDEMDWEPSTTTRVTKAARERAKWVSKDELERRREANACFRCGKKGHMLSECQL